MLEQDLFESPTSLIPNGMYFHARTKTFKAKVASSTCEGYNARRHAAVASAPLLTKPGMRTKDGMPEPFASQTKQPAAYRVCYTEA